MAGHLSEGQFWDACKYLHSKADRINDRALRIELFKASPPFMRLTRILLLDRLATTADHGGVHIPDVLDSMEEEEEIEEDVIYSELSEASQSDIKVLYDVSYSPTYQVPVLYFQLLVDHVATMDKMQFVYEHLVPRARSNELKSIGIIGGISQVNHPATDVPCYFVHPCRTAEAMESLIVDRQVSPQEYLQIWIGLIGSSVGLNLPIELAMNTNH